MGYFFVNLLFSFTSFLVYYSSTVIEFICLLLICLVAEKTISLAININLWLPRKLRKEGWLKFYIFMFYVV